MHKEQFGKLVPKNKDHFINQKDKLNELWL